MLQAESTGEICVKIRTLGHLMLSEYSLAWARFTFIVLIAEIAKCGITMIIVIHNYIAKACYPNPGMTVTTFAAHIHS